MDFQDGGDNQSRTRNPNIRSDGSVDPRSKNYQRSVAGRQKLEDYIRDLWDQGKDEKDVFMAAVDSLMQRGHGYVAAYLDSKNPSRKYTEPQAMKIADEVMKKAGIGSHPGARLTPAKDEEEREGRKSDRAQRREARKAGPKPAPGVKAKPVGQQRKEGKRPGTGEPAGGTEREGIGQPATGPVSGWQKTLKDRVEGKASTEDVLDAFQKEKQSKLPGTGRAASAAKPSAPAAAKPSAPAPAPETAKPPSPAPESEPPAPDEDVSAPDTEEPGRLSADPVSIGNKFKELVQDSVKANIPIDKNSLESMIQETIEILEDDFDVDPEAARETIFRRFNNKLIEGQKIAFDPSSAPEQKQPATAAPQESKPAVASTPEEPAPSPVKETVKSASSLPPDQFRNEVMKQLRLPLGARDAKTRIAEGAAARRGQKLEGQRAKTETEMAKAARPRGKQPVQPELFTPGGKPRQFKTEAGTNPLSSAVAEVKRIVSSPDVKKATLDSFARMVLNGIERHKRATGGKGFG
jgi:hypothetical protein